MHSNANTTTLPPVHIWKGTGAGASRVTLTPYLPAGVPKAAIIVCPGGSYFWLDKRTEGHGVAKWLSSNGIAAFVLRYRVAGAWSFITGDRALFPHDQYPDMITDLQRAIQLIRENAQEYNCPPDKIGVMGFSAGGHLAMSSGVYHKIDFLAMAGICSTVSLRPDFVVPVYPVVTLCHPEYTHKRSRRGLLGEWRKNSKRMRDRLSLEKNIPEDCPPTFLMNCVDDPIVKYQNSELLAKALADKKITHKYIQYKTGGHGFGATKEKTTEEAIAWCGEFLEWLDKTIL